MKTPGIVALGAVLLIAGAVARAESFPPVTDAERAIDVAPGNPNAAAVVLWRRGEMTMLDPLKSEVSSHLTVEARIKVLKKEGAGSGNIAIAHNGWVRLTSFEGRTVLPDGRVVPVPQDVRFERTVSRSKRIYVTSVAFPAVEPGAILDYRFEVSWDSIFYLDPWFFQESGIPVLHSEIAFEVPKSIQARVWSRDPMRVGIQTQKDPSVHGVRMRAWADNLPPVPDEPHGPAFPDMAAQLLLVPSAFTTADVHEALMESWASTCAIFQESYEHAERRDGDLGQRTKTLVAGAKSPRAAAEAIYRFVRDDIGTEPLAGVSLRKDATLAQVLEQKRGDYAEKALLLRAMLEEAKLPARLVWVADRDGGAIDLALPNPAWFDGLLVAVELEGQRVFLDPNDRRLAFGNLAPGLEGTTAILWDPKKPEALTLPESPLERNLQSAALDLTVDTTGRASGTGVLKLTGAPAWQRSRWRDDAAQTSEAWKSELARRLPGFSVRDPQVEESPDQQAVTVHWTMASKDEEVLGNELTIDPVRPVGPAEQPFPRGSARNSAILLDFASRGEVELRLHWPQGWQPEALPTLRRFQNAAGTVEVSQAIDADGLGLVYRRRFDIAHRSALNREQLGLMQALFEQAVAGDAQSIVLVRR